MFVLRCVLVTAFLIFSNHEVYTVDVTTTLARIFLNVRIPPGMQPFNDAAKQEALLEVTQAISKAGYPAENHTVQTADGYLLTFQRIPYSIKNNKPGGIPVLLLPGGSCHVKQYVESVGNSLGFFLSDNGYDVWLGTFRGNHRYDNRHVNYTQFSYEFWDFTWDDHATYDIPALIDYVLHSTGYKRLLLVSYSFSGMASLAMMSKYPEYNDKLSQPHKVAGHAALAPFVSAIYNPSFFTIFVRLVYHLLNLARQLRFGFDPIFAIGYDIVTALLLAVCPLSDPYICRSIFYQISGFNGNRNNIAIPVIFADISAALSLKTVLHVVQNFRNKVVAEFDYGKKENLQRYKTEKPPVYDFSRVTTPTVISYAANDVLSDPLDIMMLKRQMNSNIVYVELLPDPMDSHAELVWTFGPLPIPLYGKLLRYFDQFWYVTRQ